MKKLPIGLLEVGMLRAIVIAIIWGASQATAAPLLRLSSDQNSYQAGGTARLTAFTLISPSSPSEDFYLGSTLNNVPLDLVQSQNGIGTVLTGPLPQGNNTWSVQLYVEDAVLAGQLNRMIQDLSLQNDQIQTQLSQTSDPVQIAQLRSQLTQNQQLITEAQNELALNRRPFGQAETIHFYAL